MIYRPTPPLEAFAEALSVPAMLHTPPRDIRVLVVGLYALPMAKLALRYPTTLEVVAIVPPEAPLPRDRRVRRLDQLRELEADWRADVVAVAMPGDCAPTLQTVKGLMAPDGLAVIAIDTFARGRDVKECAQKLWTHVVPYREHAPEPVLFFLASDRRIGHPMRPIPPNLSRITKGYLPALFALGKDEYTLLYGDRR